ncbi:MAG: hypothetical protein KJP00_01995 [Bacteroidia bacterium]|nr:hypothetical protein [Bacteroidia bacterium]
MSTNKILIAGVIGGVVAFILGFLTYGIVLSDFWEANTGTATGVMKADDEILIIPMIIGHLTWGMLFALIFGRWANIKTFATGAKAGAAIGLLCTASIDLVYLATMNISTTTSTIVNLLCVAFISAIVGGAVGWFLGRE